MISEAILSYRLKRLGDTPIRVAANLLNQGIDGVRGSAGSCPVANYLKRHYDCSVYVSPRWTDGRGRATVVTRSRFLDTTLSEAVRRFAVAFDAEGWDADFAAA